MTKIKFNAFDRDSSASFSKTVEVETVDDLQKESKAFDEACPFLRFYRESEIEVGNAEDLKMVKVLEKLDNG